MIKKLVFSSTILVTAFFAWSVLADTPPVPTHPAMEKSLKDKKQEIQDKKKEMKSEMKEKRTQVKEEMKEKRMEIKQDLRKVKDEKKKAAADKIVQELTKLNAKKMEQFSKALDQLEKVLGGAMERADKKATKGFDVSEVKIAIEEAKAAIVSARSAVETQKGKVYKLEAASDDALKEAVKNLRKALESDLKVVQEAVKNARQAVNKVAKVLAHVRRKRTEPSPGPLLSPSASVAPLGQ